MDGLFFSWKPQISLMFLVSSICRERHVLDVYFASSLPVSSEEGRSEGYSSGLQLPDKEKTLEFEPEKPVYSSKVKMKTEGDVARLSVTVTGSPTPKVQWFFNNMKLNSSTDCKLVFAGNDHSLILPYVGVQDEGEYTCVASNIHGETKCSARLHVHQRIPGVPCFARKPDSIRCAPGFNAVFEYTVAGEPCPDVLWFKGSEQLFSDEHHSVAHHSDGSGSLTVQECKEEDTGLYMCKAVSALGEATCSAELLVLPGEHVLCCFLFSWHKHRQDKLYLDRTTSPIFACEVNLLFLSHCHTLSHSL
uniref:Uncharacterized protein n=1 Tax=Melopsittacus undulatus TaxID=13146 RepID=A0A8C6J7G5_MELUD